MHGLASASEPHDERAFKVATHPELDNASLLHIHNIPLGWHKHTFNVTAVLEH